MPRRLLFAPYAVFVLLATALAPAATCAEPKEAPKASVSGTVVDASGRPVPSATVWLREGEGNGQFSFRNVKCGPKGEFAFDKVEPAYGVTLAVVAEGHSYGAMNVHDLQPAKARGNLRLVVTEPRELRLQVVDADGNPVRDVEVDWIRWKTANTAWFGLPLEVLRRARIPTPLSDKKGELSIPDVPAGCECEVQLSHPDHARQIVRELSTDKDAPIKVVLQPGTVIRVEVTEAATGRPAVGARVWLSGGGDGEYIHDAVDNNGNWTARVVNPKRFFSIHVRHPTLLARHWISLHQAEPDPDGGYKFRVALFRKAKVQGRVTDEKAKPAAGVFVGLAVDQHVISQNATDAKGEYVMEGPEGESAVLVMSSRGFYADDSQQRPAKLAADGVTKVPDIIARRLPPIRGTVVLPDGRPAAKALVQNGETFRQRAVLADENGAFELPLDEKPHVFAHVIGSHLNEKLSRGVTVEFERIERGEAVRIQLESESSLHGVFKGTDGKPIGDAELTLVARVQHLPWSTHFPLGTVRTNPRGEFRFPGLSRHMSYKVQLGFSDEPSPTRPKEFVKADGDEIEFDVTMADDAPGVPGKPPRKPKVPRDAPELSCQAWINSEPLNMKSLRGKVVMLDFSSRYSGPVENDLLELQLAHELFASKGLVIVGIHKPSMTEDELRKAVKERKVTFPVALDGPQNETAAKYDAVSRFVRVLIGRDGRVISSDRLTQNLLTTLRRHVLYGQNE